MDSATALAADKKRNKLGYHRTSVACVHCRRRKIRCLLAPDDAQGRCENCIRLKKECNFYPVDQQPPVEKRSRSRSKMESVSSGPSTSSSPSFAGGNIGEQSDAFSQYPSAAPYSSGRQMSSFDSITPTGVSMSSFNSASAHDFKPTPPLNQQASWDNAALFQQPMMPGVPVKSQLGDQPPILWSQGGSELSQIPTTPGMSMASESHIRAINRNTGLGLMQEGGSVWHPQTSRPMALQNNPQLAVDFSNQFQSQIPQNLRNPSYQNLHPPVPDMIPGQIPVSLDPTQHTPASFGYQTWDSPFSDPSNQGIPGTGADAMGGWYAEQPHFPRTREPE
ncbi:hypothetical protein FQN54_008809 [Arachnomyces sp. PD_36]|nr:hypothetical protein FQN54_008809 [Arachnomyces sp. PD_36]